MQQQPRELELLAPARDCETARQAIIHGADAVYIGSEAFGARAAATNSVDEIAGLTEFAHSFNARVYVTLNTLIYENELADAERLVKRLYDAGVDALIVQDMALLRMDLPPIALHASTQCDTRDAAKARFLEDCGFSQIVLARELSLGEIREIAAAVTVPLEAFVHGALCVSYSGDCQASLVATGRSANRGECAQMCRLSYSLTDRNGHILAPDAHYLSLRDMNRLDRLADMADAGISSFKIEGRLKESDYVRNTVAAYSQALDRIVASSEGRYRRASSGRTDYSFIPNVAKSFNRRFTSYFLDGRPSGSEPMASLESPKWIGQPVGKITGSRGKAYIIRTDQQLSNGDGLGYFDADRHFCGFRLNRVDGRLIYPASDVRLSPGMTIYRNRDKKRDDIMSGTTAVRHITVTAELRRAGESLIALKLTDDRGRSAEATAEAPIQTARTPQKSYRQNTLSKLGDTIYSLEKLDDTLGDDDFIAASTIADLRRRTAALLDSVRRSTYVFSYRRPESAEIAPFKNTALDRHDNVANSLARKFYSDHGIEVTEPALEVMPEHPERDLRVMTTRYCLRRELGACLLTESERRLPSPLFLKTSSGLTFGLEFDCRHCRMHVISSPSEYSD